MSQNHEITKLHIFPCHSWNNYDTFQLQIQIVDGILTNNVNALNCTIHCNADCNVIVNVPRRQRRLQQPINSSRTNAPFRDEWKWISPWLIEFSTSSSQLSIYIYTYIHLYKHPRAVAPIDEVYRCSHTRIHSRIPFQSVKVHLPVQHSEVFRPKDSMASHGCEWSQKYLYTPTQAGRQSRTDCFTQTSRSNSWLRSMVQTTEVVDNPHMVESASYLHALQ